MPFYKAGSDTSLTFKFWRTAFFETDWLLDAVQQALGSLCISTNWEGNSTFTPEDCVNRAQDVLGNFMPSADRCGMILPFAGDLAFLTADFLICDGASYAVTDWPDLYDAIGNTYGGTPMVDFNVPNLSTLVIAGVDYSGPDPGFDLGNTGGEFEHTLVTAEIPSHTHTDLGHTHVEGIAGPNATTIGPGAPQPTAIPAVGVTGSGSANLTSTGGDGPHNNLQPYMAVNYVIQAVRG
jgi:microcystin-dependent protein